MNRIFLSGRWTADPKTSSTAGNEPMTIAKGSIAVDRRGKDKGADFINVVAFGKIADHIGKYYTNANRDRSEYYRRYYQSRKENIRQAMQDV